MRLKSGICERLGVKFPGPTRPRGETPRGYSPCDWIPGEVGCRAVLGGTHPAIWEVQPRAATRLLEFGRFAAENREKRGQEKPETFNFLGFTHICGKTRKGRFTVMRQTIRKRLQAKLNEVKAELRRRMHEPIPEVGRWLRAVVGGHIRYYGVPMNGPALSLFRFQVGRRWHRVLCRRSQKGYIPWTRMRRLIARWLPPARISHPYPLQRLGVVT